MNVTKNNAAERPEQKRKGILFKIKGQDKKKKGRCFLLSNKKA